MIVFLFFYKSFQYHENVRREHEKKIDDVNLITTMILQKAVENINKESSILTSLDELNTMVDCINFDDYGFTRGKEMVIDIFTDVRRIFFSIINSQLDEHIVKFILSITLDRNKKISESSIYPFYITLLIQDLMIVCSSERKEEYYDIHWILFAQETLSHEIYKKLVSKSYLYADHEAHKENIRIKIMRYLFIEHMNDLLTKYDSYRSFYGKILFKTECNLNSQFMGISSLKTRYFFVIKKMIDSFEDKSNEVYYLLLNYNGLKYNRICSSSLKNLFRQDQYKTFEDYFDMYEFDRNDLDFDLSYLEGKVFNFNEEIEFEYIMGLLQYASYSYQKHLICMINKRTNICKIKCISYVSIEELLNDLKKQVPQETSQKYF